MGYSKFREKWFGRPDPRTPVTPEAIEHIEDGVARAHEAIDALGDISDLVTKEEASATYAPARLASLLSVLDQPRSTGPVTTDVPTVTFGTAVAVTPAIKYTHDSGVMRMLGWVPKPEGAYFINSSAGGSSEDGAYGFEIDWYGPVFEATFQQLAASARVHIFVDDRPVTTEPQTPTTGVGTCYMKLEFTSTRMRRIKVLARKMGFFTFAFPQGRPPSRPPQSVHASPVSARRSRGGMRAATTN
ncbi:hypothetical protein [Prescottella equi]|uniref:hypothetical protein n=1 Tax=Rhodococcus hoagii TaxID=43767 RepID=UPI000D0E6190|nr:hypothetical protein [Prescottella equi]AVP67316.1 hypothetical protein C7H75_04745 [Prescottella equi]